MRPILIPSNDSLPQGPNSFPANLFLEDSTSIPYSAGGQPSNTPVFLAHTIVRYEIFAYDLCFSYKLVIKSATS